MIRYWGQEPFYFGWENEAREADKRIFSKSWFHEVDPPHRAGKALRVRIRDHAVHIGVCGKAKRPAFRDTDATIEEIKKWVYDDAAEKTDPPLPESNDSPDSPTPISTPS